MNRINRDLDNVSSTAESHSGREAMNNFQPEQPDHHAVFMTKDAHRSRICSFTEQI